MRRLQQAVRSSGCLGLRTLSVLNTRIGFILLRVVQQSGFSFPGKFRCHVYAATPNLLS